MTMTRETLACDLDLGPLYPESLAQAETKMFSFAAPSHAFWRGFAEGLLERGLTMSQVIDELQSKGTRWLLDAQDTQIALAELGRKMAESYKLCCE
jgi:hypothetical protein